MINIFQKIFPLKQKITEIGQKHKIRSLISANEIHQKKYQYMTMYNIETDNYEIEADCMFHIRRHIETVPYHAQYFLMYIQKKPTRDKHTVVIKNEKFAKRMYNKMQRKWNRNKHHVK